MSKVASLQASVQKAETKVEKCKATIVRHEKALAKKIDALEKSSGRTVNLDNLDSYKWSEDKGTNDYYWDACEVESKMDDIKGATKKLVNAEVVLGNWEARLQKEVDKNDFINTIPQVLKDFLEAWKNMAYDWHVKRYESYLEFSKSLDKEASEAEAKLGIAEGKFPSKTQRKALEEMNLDYNSVSKRKTQYAGVVVLKMCSYRNEEERLVYLNTVLESEKKRKALDLVNRINHVVGEIVDVSSMRVSEKLNLDGIIVGTKANAKVETIGAGGYAVQCFHYRTLVNEI